MNSKRLVATGVMLALASFAFAQTRRVHLIETGQFHGDEVSARTGQRWMGLFLFADRSLLRYSTLKVRNVFDDVIDYGAQQKTGKKVSVRWQTAPMLLLKGAAMLRPGRVRTVFKAEPDLQERLEKSPIKLKLGRKSYSLTVVSPSKTPRTCPYSDFPWDARLVLASGKSRQVLYRLDSCGNDPSWFLLWAGDLDHDGKLDMYVSVTQHYDYSDRVLFLSSSAKKGKLVRPIAIFETSGC